MRGGDAAVNDWIDHFVRGKMLPLPHPQHFDFQVFSDGQPMYDLIQRHNAETGLSDYPFTVLDGKTWYVSAVAWGQDQLHRSPVGTTS